MAKEASPHQAAATAWVSLAEHLQAGSVLHEGSPRLAEYALDHFDSKVVIERLLAPEPTYFALRDILFAGLCAWTVAPQYPRLAREAMILTGMSRLAELERKRLKDFPHDALLADIVNRLSGPGIDFYRDFYFPAGGLQRIIEARSPKLMRRSLLAASKNIGFQVEMMRICHYHAERLQGHEKYHQASFEMSSKVIAKLIEEGATPWIRGYRGKCEPQAKRTVNALNCKKKSASYNASACLIYAASSIHLQSGSLLSAMCTGNATFRNHGQYLRMWVGRAIYSGKTIIGPMYPRLSTNEQVKYLPSSGSIKINMPDFDGQSGIINSIYGRGD